MHQYITKLNELKAAVPEQYSEKNLADLDQIVREYSTVLNAVAQTEQENNTEFYRMSLASLESRLENAKYGHTEKQRNSAFLNARSDVLAGISALLNNLGGFNMQHP